MLSAGLRLPREPAESMFPRAGDLRAHVRAPVSPDWAFRRVPLFRIHKALFVHAMHRALASPAPCSDEEDDDPRECARGESPDSDATLVDEDEDEGWPARWRVLAELFAGAKAAPGFDALMRRMVEDAIDAGRVEVRAPGAGSRAKARFFVPDDDADDERAPAPPRAGDESDSDDEADGYDYGAPVARPVYGRLAGQLETRRRVLAGEAILA
jgi:hypothetical protein